MESAFLFSDSRNINDVNDAHIIILRQCTLKKKKNEVKLGIAVETEKADNGADNNN